MPKSVDGDIRISVNFDNNGIKKGVRSTESAISGLKSALGKLGTAMAAAFSVKVLIDFGKQAINLASDVQEVQNVVDTAFGEMAYKCEEFADIAIEEFGMSKLSAKQTASTYMAMAKSMGLSMDAASNMAIETAKLTGDVASFYNLDQATAATKLKGIFTGESEALKDLGVVMTETNLQEYALSKGITTKYSAMSQAEKVMLRYEYVTNALSDASGDFVRTQDSWANQTRILSEQWKELMSAIGSSLITVLTPLLQLLNSIVSVMVSFAQKANELVSALASNSDTSADQSRNIEQSVENQKALTSAVNETAEAQEKSLAGFDEINKMSSGPSETSSGTSSDILPSGVVGGAKSVAENSEWAESAAASIKYALSAVLNWFKTTWGPTFTQALNTIAPSFDGLKKSFADIFSDLGTLVSPVISLFNDSIIPYIKQYIQDISIIVSSWIGTLSIILSGIWSNALYPVLQTLISTVYPMMLDLFGKISSVLTQVFTALNSIIQSVFMEGVIPVIALLANVFNGLWGGIADAYNKWVAPIFEKLSLAIKNTKTILQDAWDNCIKPIWDAVMESLTKIWNESLKPLWDNVLDFVGQLIDSALTIYNEVITPIVDWIAKYLYPIVVEVAKWIIGIVTPIIQGIISAVGNVIDALKGVLDFIVGVFTGNWEQAWNGIKTFFKEIWDSFVEIVKIPLNLVIDLVNTLLSAVIGGINKIISAINTLSFDVPDWVPGIGGETFGFNLKEIEIPQIPKLAQGAVIPANKPFLSILGDQRNGTNLETPLSTMIEAFNAALDARGGRNEAVLEIDGEQFGRIVYRLNKQQNRRIGVVLSEV